MSELARIANTRKVAHFGTMLLQELEKERRTLVGESEDDLLPHLFLGDVAGDAPEDGEAAFDVVEVIGSGMAQFTN